MWRHSLVLLLLLACRRERREFSGPVFTNAAAAGVRVDDPAPQELPPAGSTNPFAGNAWAASEGQRLYHQMNCVGCHAMGGGGMGPALMDGKWIYGSDDASIFTTIVLGRPNGMPAYRGRLSDDQIWQLGLFVKSLGGYASKQVESARDDHMSVRPGPLRTEPEPTVEHATP